MIHKKKKISDLKDGSFLQLQYLAPGCVDLLCHLFHIFSSIFTNI